MAEFKIPPLSTLVGSSWPNFVKSLRGNRIEKKYYPRIVLTALVIALASPLRVYEYLRFKSALKKFSFKKDPIFIIGHWRSGTTILHNVLCKAPTAGFLTTYFSVFPNYIASKWLFKPFMRAKMPDKRPSDNVKLRPEAPQEDEFALGNFIPYIYYNFWLFPDRYKEFYDLYVRFKGKPGIKKTFKENYRKLLAKALMDTGGTQAVIKNPVNTARIGVLLEMFPDAKFIYIYRNPLTVYLSSLKFFKEVLPSIWFHRISDEQINKVILDIYIRLLNDYERDKGLIPAGNLTEVRYEDFEQDPITELEKIHRDLKLENFEENKKYFENYLHSVKGYEKNKYTLSENDVEIVRNKWGYAMERFGYSIPSDPDIKLSASSHSL